jgi:hypothetical protein
VKTPGVVSVAVSNVRRADPEAFLAAQRRINSWTASAANSEAASGLPPPQKLIEASQANNRAFAISPIGNADLSEIIKNRGLEHQQDISFDPY